MKAANIFIRALVPDDWKIFSEIRLEGLRDHPGVFGSSFAKESQFTEQEWRAWLRGETGWMFGLFDEGKLIGINGLATSGADASGATAVIISSYIRASHRGQGLAEPAYRACLQCMLEQERFSRVIVSHRESNQSSCRANQKFGFRYTHRAAHTWPDGTVEDQLFYELTRAEVATALGIC